MVTMLKESIFIVNQLNKEPFLKNLSFPSFEALDPLMLMGVLNEVLTEIQPKYAEIIQDKTAEERVQEMINLLSILEYESIKDCCDLQAIREGLETNDKVVIYPVLFWLLQNIPTLKRKAYLSQFTLEVDVPVHFQQDESISIYVNRQKELIQKFQHLFPEYEDLQPFSVSKNNEIAENKMLQNHKCRLLAQKEKLQRALESSVKSPAQLLKVARQLRLEMERQEELTRQSTEQKEELSQAQKTLSELEQQTRGRLMAGGNPAAVMEELQEEIEANTVKVMEKLPRELEDMRKKVKVLQKLAEMPGVTASQLLEMKNQLKNVTSQMHKHNIEMAINQTCEENRLNSTREKASAINQTKNLKAKELRDLKDGLASAERELKVVATWTGIHGGERSLRDQLKCKKNNLRKKNKELGELKAKGVGLHRTVRTREQTERYFQPLVQILEAEKEKTSPGDAQATLERMVAVREKEQSHTDKSEMRRLKSMTVSLGSHLSEEEHRTVRQQSLRLLNRFEDGRVCRTEALKERVKLLRSKTAELERQCIDQRALREATKMKLEATMLELKAYSGREARDQTTENVKAKRTEPHSRPNRTK